MNEVEIYLEGLTIARTLLARNHSEGVADLRRQYRRREIEKSGRLEGGLEYDFHGAGCRFVIPGGRVVEVDIYEGLEVFDPWKIRDHFSGESDGDRPAVDEIKLHCDQLVRTGRLIEPRQGWYSDRVNGDRIEADEEC
ncbi:DUF6896 domain-containing protein [Pseudonocardia oroxyli]|uniref:DUF6896 domain-containing protein n=1 Tax=Pseudonocardia oroxyli TaxID=366584 RepID=UPI00115FC48D|nr:hypothetical protein [Pseudonocardia oroxyli]